MFFDIDILPFLYYFNKTIFNNSCIFFNFFMNPSIYAAFQHYIFEQFINKAPFMYSFCIILHLLKIDVLCKFCTIIKIILAFFYITLTFSLSLRATLPANVSISFFSNVSQTDISAASLIVTFAPKSVSMISTLLSLHIYCNLPYAL